MADGTASFGGTPDAPWTVRLREAMRAGTPTTERELAAQFGVTRHALRRALARLREAGEAPPSPGPRVARQLQAATALLAQDTNPLEILEVRLALEPILARLAALRATPSDITRILGTATTSPGQDIAAADLAFHTAVASGARNGLAASLYGVLRQIAEVDRNRLPPSVRDAFAGDRVPMRDCEHRAVAEAIAARDSDAAEAAMRAHLQTVSRTMTERLTA